MTDTQKKRIIISTVVIIIGLYLHLNFKKFLNNQIRNQLQIRIGNDFTVNWLQPPIPIYLNAYIFGIENFNEFERGAKARIRQYGPFQYNLQMDKEIIEFSNDQRMVKYYDIQTFYFDPDHSNGLLSQRIRFPNVPVYAMASMVNRIVKTLPFSFVISPILFGFLNLFFLAHGEFMTKELSIGELLNGYPFTVLDTIDLLTRPLSLFGIQLPDPGMPENKFGFLWTKNSTKNGPLEAFTGQKDTETLKISGFKNKKELDFYDETVCNALNGTDGTVLGLDIQKDLPYYVFNADLCRSIDLVYDQESWVNGIRAYRFILNPLIFSAPRKNPTNRCFCTAKQNEDWCDGVFDLTRCVNAPLAYSMPHFFGANRLIQENVDGLRPRLENHQTHVDIEPITGAPLRGVNRLQINLLLDPIPYSFGFRNVRKTVLPLIWLERSAEIDEKLTRMFQMSVYPVYIIRISILVSILAGTISLIYYIRQSILSRSKVIDPPPSRASSTEPILVDA